MDESVIQGSNANIECVHRTLIKLQSNFQTWPSELFVQLDNTAKDNKNNATLGYFAYLVASGVFLTVIVSFLPVGHTHEDIDAVFGMIMRWLHKHRCLATIEKLMDAIYEGFFSAPTRQGKRVSRSSWRPSHKLEQVNARLNG